MDILKYPIILIDLKSSPTCTTFKTCPYDISYFGEQGPNYEEDPHSGKVEYGGSMDAVVFFGETADLCECEQGGEDSVVGEEDIVEVDFACLVIADEVSV